MDDRSGKKGVEAENVTIGTVGEKTYAFIGLERIGGVMAYDITNPDKVFFANYINSRDFSADIAGDVSPEGLCMISASESGDGNAYLLASCEVSGTVAVYKLTSQKMDSSGNDNTGGNTDNNTGNNTDNNANTDSNPGGSDNGSAHTGNPSDGGSKISSPKTGDQTPLVVTSVLLFGSAAVLLMSMLRKKNK